MAQSTFVESVVGHIPSWEEVKQMSSFTLLNYTNYIMLVSFVVLAIFQAKRNVDKARKLPKHLALPAPDFPPIKELEGFDLKTAEPIKLRPFKPKYHLTMADATALETLEPFDLLLMDNTYTSRIAYRRQILQTNPTIALGVHNDARIRPAVCELYTFLTGTYLPLRYPSMFLVHHTEFGHGKESVLQNLVTGEIVPTRASGEAMPCVRLLETLGRHVDEDFLVLMPEEGRRGKGGKGMGKENEGEAKGEKANQEGAGGAKYVLEAYVSCCPSGFNPAEKLGKKLRDIHAPVPGYADKLEGSMDRYFKNVEVGKYVKRVNWSVTMSAELFQPGLGSNHAHKGEEVVEFKGELDPDQTFVRCERQTLHRLPKSKALVFAFKTYMYPIREIKEEGLGEELAEAIDGLKEGNVPEIHFYKRGVEWGNALKKYLRS